jgi:hypothetical protein
VFKTAQYIKKDIESREKGHIPFLPEFISKNYQIDQYTKC